MMDGSTIGIATDMTTVVCSGVAYMNPGTGSFILQMLLIGLAGGVLAVRNAWGSLKGFFTRKKP